MNTLNVKKGDNVVVNSGESKGMTGKVLSVNVEKKTAIVEGLNKVKRSTKPNAKNPQGGFVEKEAPLHVSKLNRIGEDGRAIRANGKPTKIKINN